MSSNHNCHREISSSVPSAELAMHRPPTIPSTYSVIEPLTSPAPPPDNELSIFKVAKEILSSVKPGSDVTNINLPASVLDPVSTLEKTKNSMQRGELIQDICNPRNDALTRFMNVIRFNISGLVRERFGKKPFNPVLGELYRCCFAHRGEGGVTVLVSEQVSHHPPITALHLRNQTLGFYLNSHTAPEPRFWGNSLIVRLPGAIRIVLEKFNSEEYVITRPDLYMTGFIAGRQRLEFNGVSSFACEKTGLGAEIEYKAKGAMTYRAEMNGIVGRIFELSSGKTLYNISGNWDKIVTLTDINTQKETVLFDYEAVMMEKSMLAVLPPDNELEDCFSTVIWKDCSKAIRDGQTVEANNAKRKVEEHQRRLRKERTEANAEWKLRYFNKRLDLADGYDLRDELKKLDLCNLSVSNEELRALKSGDLTERIISNSIGNEKEDENTDGGMRTFFRRKLLSRNR